MVVGMSKYEWERGVITLPSSAARSMRTRFVGVAEELRDKRIKLVEDFYDYEKANTPRGTHRSPATIDRSLEAWEEHRDAEDRRRNVRNGIYQSNGDERDDLAAGWAATDFIRRRAAEGKYTAPSGRDLKEAFPKPPKSGPISVKAGPDGTATLDGTTLTWDVPSNNHAVEDARSTRIARAMFGELRDVEWSKGTGGKIVGNDEYNEEAGRDYEGGGSNYVNGGYGPIGDPHFVTKSQHAALQRSAQTFRGKPGNAGLCGMRTIVNGKRVGAPCRNRAGSCPQPGHGSGRAQRAAW